MKLSEQLVFTTFRCPALMIEMMAGQIVYVTRTELCIREANEPNVLHVIPRSVLYHMTIDIRVIPRGWWMR